MYFSCCFNNNNNNNNNNSCSVCWWSRKENHFSHQWTPWYNLPLPEAFRVTPTKQCSSIQQHFSRDEIFFPPQWPILFGNKISNLTIFNPTGFVLAGDKKLLILLLLLLFFYNNNNNNNNITNPRRWSRYTPRVFAGTFRLLGFSREHARLTGPYARRLARRSGHRGGVGSWHLELIKRSPLHKRHRCPSSAIMERTQRDTWREDYLGRSKFRNGQGKAVSL